MSWTWLPARCCPLSRCRKPISLSLPFYFTCFLFLPFHDVTTVLERCDSARFFTHSSLVSLVYSCWMPPHHTTMYGRPRRRPTKTNWAIACGTVPALIVVPNIPTTPTVMPTKEKPSRWICTIKIRSRVSVQNLLINTVSFTFVHNI